MLLKGIEFLNSLSQWGDSGEISLEAPAKLSSALGNPQNLIPSVHVAGTNGKGSVTAMLGAIAAMSGLRVGQFFSPHLSSVCERCVIDGRPIAEKALDKFLLGVQSAALDLNVKPSYFEAITVASFLAFKELAVDLAVIEVGLGGRLDATNIIECPELCLITSIDYDHTHILGETLAEIAGEKAGIIKAQAPVFCGRLVEEAKQAILNIANQQQSAVEFLGEDFDFKPDLETLNFSSEKFGLRGAFQCDNIALVIRAALYLGFDAEQIERGLKATRWPGRMELLRGAALKEEFRPLSVLLDAAHNPAGIEQLAISLAENVSYLKQFNETLIVFSLRQNKDYQQVLLHLVKISELFCCDLEMQRVKIIFTEVDRLSESAVLLADVFNEMLPVSMREKCSACVLLSFEDILAEFRSFARSDAFVLITGSIYLLGKIRPQLTDQAFRTFEIT